MSEDVDKEDLDVVKVAIAKLEGRVEQGFAHIEAKMEQHDVKYARQDAVMALHQKSFDNAKEIGQFRVDQENQMGSLRLDQSNQIGTINAEIASLKATIKVWSAAAGIIMGIVYFVLGQLLPGL